MDENGDWMPSRQDPLISKHLTTEFIQKNAPRDWFMRLAWAMITDKDDHTQGRMLAKFYVFMHEFIPEGLTGKFSHIRGRDVVNFLLCHLNEYAPSRHKATKKTEPSLAELKTWMSKGKSWVEAAKFAKAVAKEKGSKRKIWKAPGWHSPAHLLALLIIAYPDHLKYKQWIDRLDISWMIRDVRSLKVCRGFWQGIENLDNVFTPEETRTAACELLVDYDTLFGEAFLLCRKDIRPYLDPWAQDLQLGDNEEDNQGSEDGRKDDEDNDVDINEEDEPQDEEGDSSDSSVAADATYFTTSRPLPITALKASDLQEHLFPLQTKSHTELCKWFSGWLRTSYNIGGNTVLSKWCSVWAAKIRKAGDHRQQRLIRSLLLQSLTRLESLYSSPACEAAVDAYMLLDLGDVGFETQKLVDTNSTIDIMGLLSTNPEYAACADINAEFRRFVEGTSSRRVSKLVKEVTEKLFTRQARFFYTLVTDPTFIAYVMEGGLILLDKLRTQCLIQNIQDSDARDPSLRDQSKQRAGLFADNTAATLNLTEWQTRALLLPTIEINSVLTNWQTYFYNKEIRGLSISAPADPPSVPTSVIEAFTQDDLLGPEQQGIVRLFFGSLPKHQTHQSVGGYGTTALVPFPNCTSPVTTTFTRLEAAPTKTIPVTAALGTPMTPTSSGPSQSVNLHYSPNRVPTPEILASSVSGAVDRVISVDKAYVNPYKGKGIKRGSSPDTPLGKRPRLTFSWEEMTEERRAYREDMKVELEHIRLNIDAFKTESCQAQEGHAAMISKEIGHVDEKICFLEAGLNEFQREYKQSGVELSQTLDHVTASIQAHGDSLQEMDRKSEELKDSLGAYNSWLGELSDIKQLLRAFDARLTELGGKVDNLQTTLATQTPLLGQEGYLTQECVAPAGNQKDYEATLSRAAMFYFALFDLPDDGVYEDSDAMEKTMEKYPHLLPHHIAKAVEHYHILLYIRPIRQINEET